MSFEWKQPTATTEASVIVHTADGEDCVRLYIKLRRKQFGVMEKLFDEFSLPSKGLKFEGEVGNSKVEIMGLATSQTNTIDFWRHEILLWVGICMDSRYDSRGCGFKSLGTQTTYWIKWPDILTRANFWYQWLMYACWFPSVSEEKELQSTMMAIRTGQMGFQLLPL